LGRVDQTYRYCTQPQEPYFVTLTRQTRVFSPTSDEFFAEHLHRLPADWNTVRTRLPAQPWRSDNVERFKEQRLAQALWPALGRGVQRAQRKPAQHHRTVSTASATR
jgi:hypothetical protein